MKSLSCSILSLISMAVAASAASPALAGQCVLHVTRTACPGKEAESYSKCNGLQSCDIVSEQADEASCAAAALASCENKRFDVTQYKSVVARFQGIDFASGRDFCDQDSGSYVVSANYPFRGQAGCGN